MNHKEAYCAMYYKCKKCNFTTTFWNSRDGVTAFCTTCILENCDGDMCHEYFGDDTFFTVIPERASHVWVSMTMTKAKIHANNYWNNYGEKMMDEYPHLKEIGEVELKKSKLEEIYNNGHAPNLITRLEWLAL